MPCMTKIVTNYSLKILLNQFVIIYWQECIMYIELSEQQKAEGQQHGTYCKCLNEGNKLLKVLVQGQGHKSSNGIYF